MGRTFACRDVATLRQAITRWRSTGLLMGSLPVGGAAQASVSVSSASPGYTLALLLALCAVASALAWTAFRLGQGQERQRRLSVQAEHDARLRSAADTELSLREALRHAQALQTAYTWRTDAEHRLLHWTAPTADAVAAPARPAAEVTIPLLNGPLAEALGALTRPERPFANVLLQADAGPVSRWRVWGEPLFDAQGRFQGCRGVAMSTRADDAVAAVQHTLSETLRAAALPLLLAHAESGPETLAWVVSQLNPAAAALWPQARAGQDLTDLLQELQTPAGAAPATSERGTVCSVLQAALPALKPGASVDCGGWRLTRLAPTAEAHPTLLLAATAAGLVGSPAPAPEAENTKPDTARNAPAAAAGHAPADKPVDNSTAESDNFSFTLSHDLRAPIRVVEGFTRIVKEDYGRLLDRVGNDHLDRVLGAAARMNLMIDALLTLARLSSQPLAHQPVNLTQLAQFVVDDLRRHHPERQARVNIEAGLTAVGDPTLLRLVLENLLGNAWKYSARSAATHIDFRREAVNGQPVFVVRDQGAGFDMRSADRLFGLFQRLHSANDFPGTGVGLASVRRIVRRHGGEIWAEAEPGRGAAFHFTLAN
jgi:signal transduction histidine kinase